MGSRQTVYSKDRGTPGRCPGARADPGRPEAPAGQARLSIRPWTRSDELRLLASSCPPGTPEPAGVERMTTGAPDLVEEAPGRCRRCRTSRTTHRVQPQRPSDGGAQLRPCPGSVSDDPAIILPAPVRVSPPRPQLPEADRKLRGT